MPCPDTERLLEVVVGGAFDPEIQHHLRACPECTATTRLVREMRAAYRPPLHVPDQLVDRRVELITRQLAGPNLEQYETGLQDIAQGAVRALATVLLTIAATGSFAGTGLWGTGVLGALATIVAARYELRLGHRLA